MSPRRAALIVPAGLIYLAGFVIPLLLMAGTSLKDFSPLGPASDGISLSAYREILDDPAFVTAFWNSLWMAAVVVLVTAVLAYPICLYLTSLRGSRRTLLLIAVIAPLLVSVVVRTLGWQLLLGPAGVLDRLFGMRLLYTNTAVIIGLVHLFLAHMVLALFSSLGAIRKETIHAARTLGTGELRIFWRIIFPLSLPGLLAGFVITFGASTGALITPLFLGGARVQLASTEIYRSAMVFFNWPLASALAMLLLVLNYGVTQAVERAVGPWARRGR